MRILDRYVLRSVLGLFIGCLLTFLFLYIIIDLFSHLDEILKNKVALTILAQYYLAFLPVIFVQVTPVACLLATLYTFGKLNHNNELIAMRASGLSIFQVIRTIIIFGLITSVFIFWVNDKFVPASTLVSQKIKAQMEGDSKKTQEKEQEIIGNLSMYGLKNRLFFVNKFLPRQKTMEGITILEHDEHQNIVKKIVANRGVYKDGFWRFYQSITYDFNENGQFKGEPQYLEEEVMTIPEPPREFLAQQQRPEYMSISQLEDYIWKLSKSGASGVVKRLKTEFYQRFTTPLTSIIIILLGIPFSFRMKRRATGLSSIALSIIVGFLYYVLNAVSLALGNTGMLIPVMAASLSHIIALAFSLYLINTLP